MRFVFGLIIGCLLTVGAAYIHDATEPTSATVVSMDAATADGRMVNWDVVNRNVHGVNGWVQAQWAWISGHLNHEG